MSAKRMIVGVGGFKGSGKGSVANRFEAAGFHRLSFAAPLKDMVAVMFDWPRHMLEGDTEESRTWRELPDPRWQLLAGHGVFSDVTEITPRIALQRIGTNLIRNMVHPDFWLHRLQLRAEGAIVVDDARFPNELEICDTTVRVIRPNQEVADLHETETAHLKHNFNHTITNDGTLEELHGRTDELIDLISGARQ